MSDSRYRTSAGSVFTLKYPLIGCRKYRVKVLTGELAERLKDLLYEKEEENNIVIEALEIMTDPVHWFVSVDPTEAPQRIAKPHFSYSSQRVCSFALSDDYPLEQALLIGSVGHVSEERVKKYIEAQETRY
jgi:putative transposase